jgi:hypothetical protein
VCDVKRWPSWRSGHVVLIASRVCFPGGEKMVYAVLCVVPIFAVSQAVNSSCRSAAGRPALSPAIQSRRFFCKMVLLIGRVEVASVAVTSYRRPFEHDRKHGRF